MESATCKSSELEAFKIVEIAGYLYSHSSCVSVKMTPELCLGYCFRILVKVLLLPTQVKHLFVQGSYRSLKTWKVLEYYYGVFQDWKVLEKGHWSWKVLEICLTQLKNMKCMEGSKENWHWDLWSVGINVNFRALEKSIWVLEKSWKFVSEKGYEPCCCNWVTQFNLKPC